jgi:hypothetical protein
MAAMRMKLDQAEKSEILVADTDSESDAEASDLGDKFY